MRRVKRKNGNVLRYIIMLFLNLITVMGVAGGPNITQPKDFKSVNIIMDDFMTKYRKSIDMDGKSVIMSYENITMIMNISTPVMGLCAMDPKKFAQWVRYVKEKYIEYKEDVDELIELGVLNENLTVCINLLNEMVDAESFMMISEQDENDESTCSTSISYINNEYKSSNNSCNCFSCVLSSAII